MPAKSIQNLNAVQTGHSEVQDGEVGPHVTDQPQRVHARPRKTGNLHIGKFGQIECQGNPAGCGFVCDQNSQSSCPWLLSFTLHGGNIPAKGSLLKPVTG